MINFEFSSVPGTQMLDEDNDPMLDEFGEPMFDEDAILTNLWEEEAITAGAFVEMFFSSTTYRYHTLDIDLYFQSDFYAPKTFEVTSIERSSDLSVDKCTLKFSNTDKDMAAVLLTHEQTGQEVRVYIGAIGSDLQIVNLEHIFIGKITGWDINEREATITVSGFMSEWTKKTLRIAQASCPWPFGGDECGYSGTAQSCSQSYKNCKLLNNTDNFGGFVYLPKLQEVDIWWGRVPK